MIDFHQIFIRFKIESIDRFETRFFFEQILDIGTNTQT